MKLLEERIRKDGQVRPGNILKVDSFLNHQLDVELLEQLGKAFYEEFKDKGITRILTIEASGIALACLAAQYFKVPVVFAKKAKSKNLDGELYTSTVHSFTYGKDFTVTLAKKFLSKEDTVLLIDDFLAVGKAAGGAENRRADGRCAIFVLFRPVDRRHIRWEFDACRRFGKYCRNRHCD